MVTSAWDRVCLARLSSRPTTLDYIELIFEDYIELHGDRNYKDDKAIVFGLARIDNQNFTVIAQQKGRNTKENNIFSRFHKGCKYLFRPVHSHSSSLRRGFVGICPEL